ncbi:MAG TPA: hypothetical protein VMX14_01090 [Anaerolineae bacterium]|nr:hypothetical protein [Anaerolineae bacterium]
MASAVGLSHGVGVAVGMGEDVGRGVALALGGAVAEYSGVEATPATVGVSATEEGEGVALGASVNADTDIASRAGPWVGPSLIADSYQGLISKLAATTAPSATRVPKTVQSLRRTGIPLT